MNNLVQLPKILDRRGNLSFIEGFNHIPFAIKRVFWIYDVPGGEIRGGHAYKTSEEFIIALSGSFDVVLDNREEKTSYSLNRSYFGLHVKAGTWRHMENFSTNAFALVLSSTKYNEKDYIRKYEDFVYFKKQTSSFQPISKSKRKSIQININSKRSKVVDCSLINLEINHRNKGNITVVENQKTAPFNIQRVYYLYDIPGGEARGGHAHRELYQVLIAASGSFRVSLDDGKEKQTFFLNRPNQALIVLPGIWRELDDFSSGSICLVLASQNYDENDYIRVYDEFVKYKNDSSIQV